jgi:hypothetical protein
MVMDAPKMKITFEDIERGQLEWKFDAKGNVLKW